MSSKTSLYHEQVLRDLHITRLTDSSKLDQQLEKLKGTASQKLQKKALALFCTGVRNALWNALCKGTASQQLQKKALAM